VPFIALQTRDLRTVIVAIMKSPWLVLPLLMILAGCLGGMVNYFITTVDEDNGRSITKSVTLGIVASLMVPVFLFVVSSKLLDGVTQKNAVAQDTFIRDIFVFFGFCLVAAASGVGFIRSVSGRVIRELEERVSKTDKKASEAKQGVDLMLGPQIEQEPQKRSTQSLSEPRLGEEEIRILKELANGPFLLRTRTSVAKTTGIEKSKVDTLMSKLAGMGLVRNKMVVTDSGENRRRWFLTNEGRGAISRYESQSQGAQ
jgi:DNA-binding MarR family transcriptional regulator